jgi:hypothetical protein
MNSRRRFKFIAYILFLCFSVGLCTWWFNFNWARERDYQRIADMRILQADLLFYYAHYNTFKIPQCVADTVVNYCQGSGDRTINFGNLIDPLNQGNYQYVIKELTDDNFQISYALETSLPNMPAGQYILTKSSVVK